MPVFNAERFLIEAVESILIQSFTDFEFIIINDGSTDASLSILRHYEQKDHRIHLISHENSGLVKTRNELLQEAGCELVAWADSDDISYPYRLRMQVDCFLKNPAAVWCRAGLRLIDEDGWPINTIRVAEIGSTCVAMMRREACLAVGGFREELIVCEDRDMELRMLDRGEVVIVDEILIDYRQHLKSTCNSLRLVVPEYFKLVDRLAEERRTNINGLDALQRGENIDGLLPENKHAPEPAWATHSRWAWWALAEGNVKTARKHALYAVKSNPTARETWKLLACSLRGY